jgi:dihydroxy-acid dehydratase
VEARSLKLEVDEAELERRRRAWKPRPLKHLRGWPKLYHDHVLQPDQGCDLDFLRPNSREELVFVPPQVGRS